MTNGMAKVEETMDLCVKLMRLFVLDQGGPIDRPFAMDIEKPVEAMTALLAMLLEGQESYAGRRGDEQAYAALRETFLGTFETVRLFKRERGLSPLGLIEAQMALAA